MRKKKYIEYDHHGTFENDINNADENTIKKLLEVGKIKCIYATKKIISGDQIEIEIYPEFTRKQLKNDYSIKKDRNAAQKNLNSKNARKRLQRLINSNFKDGDIWATLTYEKEPLSLQEAQKNICNYIRRLKRKAKSKGVELKYIYVTEHREKPKIRCHHHLIISGNISMDEVEDTWTLGRRNNTRRIKTDDKGLTGLGEYISKDPKGSKRWCSSKNLKQPVIRKNHQDFKKRHVKRMIENNNLIREMIERKNKNLVYISEEVKYNDHNGMTYIYVKLSVPKESKKVNRE